MYHDLMDRPDELVAHESFFKDLFRAFDELLFIKINRPWEYPDKSEEFLMYSGEMQQYYYTEVAIPSPYYDSEVLKEITGHLAGDLDGS